jgi:hypothetical protein
MAKMVKLDFDKGRKSAVTGLLQEAKGKEGGGVLRVKALYW